MTITWQILKMPMEIEVHKELDSKADLQKQIESLAISTLTLSPLSIFEPEYTDNFLNWCLKHGESDTKYQMRLTDSETGKVFEQTFQVPKKTPSVPAEVDSLASSVNSIPENRVDANLPEDPFS